MGRKALQPVVGTPKKLKARLTDELAADLWAFCEVHHGSPHNRVLEKALRKFITEDLERNPGLHVEWKLLREQMQHRPAPQLVDFRPGRAKKPDGSDGEV